MRVIYEPRGRALEYAPLAASLYRGCAHRCLYCYVPDALHMKKEEFVIPELRDKVLEKFARDVQEMREAGDGREILLSFTTDPYQPIEQDVEATRRAIELLVKNGLRFTVLTKAGSLPMRDFDLLAAHRDLCRFGVTLTFTRPEDQERWEPGAAPTENRIAALKAAHYKGIRTWVSLEPVISPQQTLDLIERTHRFVDEYRVGKLNHVNSPLAPHELRGFVSDATRLLERHGKRYIIKKDLEPYCEP